MNPLMTPMDPSEHLIWTPSDQPQPVLTRNNPSNFFFHFSEANYEPPHDSYGPPLSDSYGPPPSDSYGAPPPYKPVGPILLEKRPYEPKEIKPVVIITEQTYTSFDCRKVPYPDKYYADPEAECRVRSLIHFRGPCYKSVTVVIY